MHVRAMIHCDLKEMNIMVKADDFKQPEVVIIDFGLAQSCASHRAGVCGTPGYIPPETWQTGKWYPKGDCFSIGVVMLQLIGGMPNIFTAGSTTRDGVKMTTCTREPPFCDIPPKYVGLRELLKALLEKRQPHRIAAPKAFQFTWLSGTQTSHVPAAAHTPPVSPAHS